MCHHCPDCQTPQSSSQMQISSSSSNRFISARTSATRFPASRGIANFSRPSALRKTGSPDSPRENPRAVHQVWASAQSIAFILETPWLIPRRAANIDWEGNIMESLDVAPLWGGLFLHEPRRNSVLPVSSSITTVKKAPGRASLADQETYHFIFPSVRTNLMLGARKRRRSTFVCSARSVANRRTSRPQIFVVSNPVASVTSVWTGTGGFESAAELVSAVSMAATSKAVGVEICFIFVSRIGIPPRLTPLVRRRAC